MKEIHFIINSLEVGGAERHLSQVLPALKSMGFSIKVIVLSNKAALKPIFDKAGIPVALGPNFDCLPNIIRKPIYLLTSVFRLMFNFLRNPEVIHHPFLPEAYMLTALAARLTFFKGILVMSRRTVDDYQQRRPMWRRLEQYFHRFTKKALGNSQTIVQQLCQEGFTTDQVGLIYNGIEIEPFQNLPAKSELRNSLGFRTDALVFIVVANLYPYKGHMDLLNAFALIADKLPKNWQLFCAGRSVNTLEYLENHASILGLSNHVKFLGSRTDTTKLFAASDIAISSSHEEGLSNSVLEAMATGLPLVVTNVGGNAEAVQNMVTGLVVPPKNPAILANALLYVALDPQLRQTYGSAGKERVLQYFTLQQCVQQYADFYKSLTTVTEYSDA
ncbi:MAG: glycosyltransferase [Proteobacteria bacterium]|nr:glycosyltransferase [Pseudomonadota bacterium]